MSQKEIKERLMSNLELHAAAQRLISACSYFYKYFKYSKAKGLFSSRTHLQITDGMIRHEFNTIASISRNIVAGPGMTELINVDEVVLSFIRSYFSDFRIIYPNW